MVRPTPPVIGQTDWGQPTLDAIEYATDTAEDALAGLDAKADTATVTTGLAGKSDTSHTHTYASITSKPAVIAAGTTVAEARAALNIYELGPAESDASVPTGAIIIQRVV